MYSGNTLFAQVMDFVSWTTFHRIVQRYQSNHRICTLPCAELFRVTAFAQLTWRESLRDIESCLTAQAPKLYHMGLRQPVRRSTLADANERRDWRIYAEFAQRVISRARKLYASESPNCIHVSDGRFYDVNMLDLLLPEPGVFYVMHCGYVDFERLYRLD